MIYASICQFSKRWLVVFFTKGSIYPNNFSKLSNQTISILFPDHAVVDFNAYRLVHDLILFLSGK